MRSLQFPPYRMNIREEDINPKFVQLFKSIFGFDQIEFDCFLSSFRVRHFKRKEFFLRAGDICLAKAYVNHGCTRNFVIDERGHEKVMCFAMEDWWLGDFESYYSGRPGTTFIQMMEDTEVFEISKEDFLKREQEIPKLKQWYSYKMMRSAIAAKSRLTELETLTAEERYLLLMERQPEIFQRVPLKYIASYLNIEAPSLSRLRSRLLKKK